MAEILYLVTAAEQLAGLAVLIIMAAVVAVLIA